MVKVKGKSESKKIAQPSRELRVVLNRANVVQKNSESKKFHTSAVSSLRSIERTRRLTICIRRIDIRNALDAIAISPSTSVQSPHSIATSISPNSNNHLFVAKRSTYRIGLDISPEELENLSNNPYSCGSFNDFCEECGAKFFSGEPKTKAGIRLMCCKNGKISIPIPQSPPELKPLYTQYSQGEEFLNNIRVLNSHLAMASFITSPPTKHILNENLWWFSVCGQIYEYPSIVPKSTNSRRMSSHYYFLDLDEIRSRRIDILDGGVDRDAALLLDACLKSHNSHIQEFKSMGEVLGKETFRRDERPVYDVKIAFSQASNKKTRKRWYESPISYGQIAGVFFGLEPYLRVDLKVYPCNARQPETIRNLEPASDPLLYPLLFPFGEAGYAVSNQHGDHQITMLEFYRHRIQCRNSFSLLHNAGKLFQQYIVDAWLRVEASASRLIRESPQRFRFATKKSITAALHASQVGRAIVLPQGLLDGRRNMQRLFLDAVTIVARHGSPDLFITFECNPNWREIQDNLEHLQKVADRPDLVCRVFHAKLLEFLDDVANKQIFGVVLNYHYVIDFQELFPRARIVVAFKPEDKILTPERVDQIISARIPDSENQPQLYELVKRYQVHPRCGAFNTQAYCMDGGRCKDFFPKEYSESTVLDANGNQAPIYRRPCDDRLIWYGFDRITNRNIVPYNPYTLVKYHTHINFEVGSAQNLQNLYKYVTNDVNSATICDKTDYARFRTDSLRNAMDCRYVSSMEAAWRLFDFKLNGRSHSLMVLPVHLPGEQYVVFGKSDTLEELEHRLATRSKLEAWFLLNKENADARRFTYSEIPEHFLWENGEARWRTRQEIPKVIGCLADITSGMGNVELRYLRILLRQVRGATSFESLRTVNGIVFETFKEACEALNLLNRTEEYHRCLTEAASLKSSRLMRNLFGLIVSVLSEETLGQVPLLWSSHKDSMIQDHIQEGLSRDQSLALCIREINKILRGSRLELLRADLGINENFDDVTVSECELSVISRPGEGIKRPVPYCMISLNSQQKFMFSKIIQSVWYSARTRFPMILYDLLGHEFEVHSYYEDLFFIEGAGGTGKTFLLNTIVYYASEIMKVPTIFIASTGVGANLLIRGTTVARLFKLPSNPNETSTVGWHIESKESEAIRRADLIVWDDVTMTQRYAVEAVDRFLREITGYGNTPMGGKRCVFAGDFRQILPATPYNNRVSMFDASIKNLSFWATFCVLKLHVNVRYTKEETFRAIRNEFRIDPLEELGNRSFQQWLIALGDGSLPYVFFEGLQSVPADLIEIPSIFISPSLMDLISFVYDEDLVQKDIDESAILCPTNEMAENVNNVIFDLLPGVPLTYLSLTECQYQPQDQLQIPQDIINAVHVPELPPHELKLKEGVIVMLLCNLNVENGEYKGARMKITGLGDHLIQCQLVSRLNERRTVWLPRIRMVARDRRLPQEITRTQFPVRLAYAITINDSEGQTLRRAGIYLERPCFSHGQLYMAFSRVGSHRNIRVYIKDGLKQGSFGHKEGKKFTRNVVFHKLVADSVYLIGEEQQYICRRDIATQAELEEMFGNDREDEVSDVDVSQMLQNFEEFVSNAETAESRGLYRNSYVDEEMGAVPCEFTLPRIQNELASLVSTVDRPGTSGLGAVI